MPMSFPGFVGCSMNVDSANYWGVGSLRGNSSVESTDARKQFAFQCSDRHHRTHPELRPEFVNSVRATQAG